MIAKKLNHRLFVVLDARFYLWYFLCQSLLKQKGGKSMDTLRKCDVVVYEWFMGKVKIVILTTLIYAAMC